MANKGVCRVIYDKEYDSYVLELKNKGEEDWGTVMIAKCRPDEEGDTTLIHYSILTELLKTVSNGYTLFD